MAKANVAIICISKKALLELLCFPGGVIHDIRTDPEKWNPDEIEIVLEHPDLPEMEDGYILLKINPMYIKHTKIVEDEEYSRIERLSVKE